MNSRYFWIGLGIFLFIIGAALLPTKKISGSSKDKFHSEKEMDLFKAYMMEMPPLDSAFFLSSNFCKGCHGFDPTGYAMHTSNGVDVNIYDDWRATMMANSAKDPFWRAKVSHEVLINPAHADDLENSCTSCHAPLGHYNAYFNGDSHYTMSDLLVDTVGLDGVSCVGCHQMTANNGNTFSGDIEYDTTGNLYGPFDDVFEGPMQLYTGYDPVKGEHITESEVCASCHTLIVNTVDLAGNYTGNTFVEQATYHEWLNSRYSVQDISCQECHMPRLDEPIVTATGYLALDGQFPYGQHELAGANTFMLKLMKENRAALGIEARAEDFDSTLAATYRLLQQQTLDSDLQFVNEANDTAYFELTLTNKAGHKFPSGYPSRIAYIEFKVEDETGTTIFHSGKLDANNALMDIDPNYEPHHDVITTEDQVQIYQVVNADVNGNFSTVLERGAMALKDNRLPPQGFTKSHYTIDTVAIIGNAFNDTNFNVEFPADKINPGGGNGSDIVHYHIPLNGYQGVINVTAQVHYQSLPPRWMAEMFGESTPEIDAFKAMYDAADPSIVLISENELDNLPVGFTSTESIFAQAVSIYPNPSLDGKIFVEFPEYVQGNIHVMDMEGKLLRIVQIQEQKQEVWLPETKGIYLLEINGNGNVLTKKVRRG